MESILGIIFTVALTIFASAADSKYKQWKRRRVREKLRHDLDETLPPAAPPPVRTLNVPAPVPGIHATVLPAEGTRVTPDAVDRQPDPEAARLRTHYDYWRRALIASEILNRPKY